MNATLHAVDEDGILDAPVLKDRPDFYSVNLTPDELGHMISLCLQFGITNPPGSRFYYAENTSAMRKLNAAVAGAL